MQNADPGTHVDDDVTTKSEPDYNLASLRIVCTQFAHSSNNKEGSFTVCTTI